MRMSRSALTVDEPSTTIGRLTAPTTWILVLTRLWMFSPTWTLSPNFASLLQTTALLTAETVPATSKSLPKRARIDFTAVYGSTSATISLMRMIGLTTMPVIPDLRTSGMTSGSRSAVRLYFPATTKTGTRHFSSIRKIGAANATRLTLISRYLQQPNAAVI